MARKNTVVGSAGEVRVNNVDTSLSHNTGEIQSGAAKLPPVHRYLHRSEVHRT